MNRRVGVCLGIWLVIGTSARAQTAPVPVTLTDAITRGLSSSPRVHEARARVVAAEAARDVRKSLKGPTVSMSSGYVRTNHVDEFAVPQPGGGSRVIFPDIPNNWRLRTDVVFPVFTAGRTTALVDAATADIAAAQADAAVVEADVALEIAVTYWQVVTARATVAVLDESLTRTDAWVGDVQARVDAGVASPHEVLQAQAYRARQRVQRIQAAQAATVAERDLARLTGLPAGQPLALTSPVDQPTPHVQGAAATVYTRALETRAERAALTARQTAFRAAATAALAARLPQIGTFAGIEPARPNARFVPRTDQWHTSWDLGVSVTWALWDNGRARAEGAMALAQSDALGHRLREFDARLDVEVEQRLRDLETGRAAVEASTEAVTAADEVHRVMRARFDEGVATSTEVLDAHIAWLEAALERTKLQAALRVAESRLARAVGGPQR